jgi:hypothetical protein
MASSAVRRAVHARTLLVLAAAASVPCTSYSQPGLDSLAEAEMQTISNRIREVEADGGPYSKELIDPLTSLASLYAESGNHDLAAAVTEQALQVIRANYGLRSLDQAPLIQQRIQSEQSRGNAEAAWELERALLTLARAHRDDVRSAAIFREVGDKRLDLLRRYLAGESAPEVRIGCFYKQRSADLQLVGGCSSGSRSAAAGAILASAQRHYADAINVLLGARLYSSDDLRELEMDLIRSAYAHDAGFGIGRESYSRLIAYDLANGAPLRARLDALVQLADWHLMFDSRPSALDAYQATYDFLHEQGMDQASIDEIFSPAVPVPLPVFLPNLLVTSTGASSGYVDVAFDITRFGKSDRVEVLHVAPGVSNEARKRLVRTIEAYRFRPRFVNGEIARESRAVVRYYVDD